MGPPSPERQSEQSMGMGLADALLVVQEAVIADYFVFVDSKSGESVALAEEWTEALEKVIEEEGQEIWELEVVPA